MAKTQTPMPEFVDITPGVVYARIDDALHVASCLCSLDDAGATIYGATSGPDIDARTGEAYIVAVDAATGSGLKWAAPTSPDYRKLYTLRSEDD